MWILWADMTFLGTVESYVVDYAHTVYGIGPPTVTWVPSNRTTGMTKEEALAYAAADPKRYRAVHEKVTRTLIEPPPVYGPGNPHPCCQ